MFRSDDSHRLLDAYAKVRCPVVETFAQTYHGSLMQAEYSTDLEFSSETALKPVYEQLSRQAVIAVKAENVSSFLGKKVTTRLALEIDSRLSTRFEGACIKHRKGSASVKIYDKQGGVRASKPPRMMFSFQTPPRGRT